MMEEQDSKKKDASEKAEPIETDPTEDSLRPRQLWLIPYTNPFKSRMTKVFFKTLPRTPGVYRFYGEKDELLYVGKSKNLRARVSSYGNARPGEVSRKVIRLVHLIRRVEWESCETECAALLLENRLLRDFDPPFNEANTQPQTYFFLGVQTVSLGGKAQLRLRVTTQKTRRGDMLYGAFKGRARVTRGVQALLRLSYWLNDDSPGLRVPPTELLGSRPPRVGSASFPADWLPSIRDYLNGVDPFFLCRIEEGLAPLREGDLFFNSWIQSDIDHAMELFHRGLQRTRELAALIQNSSRLLDQNQLDDSIVLRKFSTAREPSA